MQWAVSFLDLVHHHPVFWVLFCISFSLNLGGLLALRDVAKKYNGR